MAMAREEFFVRFKNWLVRGGMMVRMACGITTKRNVAPSRNPTARAASDWPFETPKIPARTISAMKEAV